MRESRLPIHRDHCQPVPETATNGSASPAARTGTRGNSAASSASASSSSGSGALLDGHDSAGPDNPSTARGDTVAQANSDMAPIVPHIRLWHAGAVANVVVIGAGMGGMATAARLSVKGHRVTVVEQSDTYGGKLGGYQRDGFVFDTGPSLLTLPRSTATCSSRPVAPNSTTSSTTKRWSPVSPTPGRTEPGPNCRDAVWVPSPPRWATRSAGPRPTIGGG